MESIYKKIESEIKKMPKNHVFIIRDLEGYGTYETVRKDLQRLESAGMIRRILNGIYCKRSVSKLTGEEVPADIYEVVKAIARKNNWTILPYGLACINMLGLSTQVPADYVFVSDGPNKEYMIGNIPVYFQHGNPKDIRDMSYKTGVIVQGIKEMGRDNISDDVLVKIGNRLTLVEKQNITSECNHVTRWIYEYIKRLGRL